jgi:hypothetical protein
MQNRIAYNINAEHPGSNRQLVADAQINLHSTCVLIMDDHKSDWFFSKQIAARSPETIRICRTFMRKDANGGWDGNLWDAPNGSSPTGFLDAPNYLNFLQGLNAPAGTYHQVLCEPDTHGERLKAKIAWLCDVIKEASKRGVRLCVDNIQTVTLDENEVNAGFYDPLYHSLSMHPEHLYGVHAYWLGDAWFNTSNQLMKMLTQNNSVDTKAFLTADDATLQAQYIAHANEAHVGREEIIAARCRKIGARVPRVVYTEIGPDNVRLSQRDAVEVINGRVPMGFPTMAQYWRVRYPQWTAAQTLVEFCKWLNRSMPGYIIGACLFGFDTAFENGTYHLASTELQTRLQNYADSLTMSEDDTPPVDDDPPADTTHAELVRLLAGTEAALVGALDAVRRARGLLA